MIIVTVVRNDLRGLIRTIASVLTKDLQTIVTKILIVDGFSTDGSEVYAKKLSSFCPTVELLRCPPKGVYEAMNRALNHLSADSRFSDESVLFLNSGDFLMSGASLQNLDSLVSETYWATGLASLIRFGEFPNSETPQLEYPNVPKPNPHEYWIPHQALLTKLEAFKEVGFFSLNYSIASDYELMGRFWEVFGPPLVLNENVSCQVLNGMSNVRTFTAHQEKNEIAVTSGFSGVELSKKIKIKWWLKEKLFLRFPILNSELRLEHKVSKRLSEVSCHVQFIDSCPWCHFSKLLNSGMVYDWAK
jgi:glycosyltransferase involved in cell wall biosynthesis